jgi:2,4-dichlorophenol 6-monooxygenase
MRAERLDVPVLVVGAGPVGLTASILLSRLGVAHLVVDRRTGPHRAPQAHAVNPRTLEICRAMGLDMARLRTLATRTEDAFWVRFMTRLAGEELGRCPYERQGDDALVYTPTPLLNLPQHLFEPELLARALEHDTGRVRYGNQWLSLEQGEDGVVSEVEDLESGGTYSIHSRYVLAADGAGSRVRSALGLDMIGPDRLQSFVMIHFEANLRRLVRERPAILYWILDPACTGSFVAHDIDRTWVFMHPYDPESEPRSAFSDSRCAEIVRRAIGRTDVELAIRDVSTWTMTAQIAARYEVGRVFLIGDSAHRFPPTGGMGMNTGIQDAHNLVWKIAAVEHGVADRSLLATYERERRPVAEHNAEQSLANAMKLLEVVEAIGLPTERMRAAIANQQTHFDMLGLHLGFAYREGALRNDDLGPLIANDSVRDYVPSTQPGVRVPHAWIEHNHTRTSILDLLPYDRFTLVTGRDAHPWRSAMGWLGQVAISCLSPDRDFSDPAGHWASVCGIAEDGALLIRPDQHVAWRVRSAPPDPAADLRATLDTILGRA